MSKNVDEVKKNSSITIKSVQACEIYKWNKNYSKKKPEAYLNMKEAVIGNSLLAEYLRSAGVAVNKNGVSYDLINVKFDYGVKDTITAENLRTLYYKDGICIRAEDLLGKMQKEKEKKRGRKKQITYKMLYRNTGKAKEGQCIFIREEYYNKVLDYMSMGLYKKMQKYQKDNAKIVEMSAYAPLISATAIDYIHIPLDNIFVVADKKATVKKKAFEVKIKEVTCGDTVSKECYVDRENTECEITNTLWDGMGLIDESLFKDNMDGFMYCRSHFFKSCLFRGNIQEYFKEQYKEEYETATATDMFGREIKVSDIKVIITENSLKWYKFTDLMGDDVAAAWAYYEKWMKKDSERFSIIKTGHESKWGDLQRSSYQINNSLPTTDEETLRNIAQESINYCDQLKLSDDAFMEHLERTAAMYNINSVLLALDEHTKQNVRYTKFFSELKKDTISEFKIKRLMGGKLLQYGDNLTICGNPIALLNEVMRKEDDETPMEDECFNTSEEYIECYAPRFEDRELLAGFRSPHNSPNNIVHLKNVQPKLLKEYFPNLGNHVIAVNGIGTDIQDRMNSMDMDSDSMYVTNQKQIAELAKKAYMQYPTIINSIPKSSSRYCCDMESYAKMDNKIASSQIDIGQASDLAQLALSYYYDSGSSDTELEDVFIICSVLAQCAIDGAKRIFDVTVSKEINRLQKLKSMKNALAKYPTFFAKVKNEERRKKRKKQISKEDMTFFKCPMDILYDIINKEVVDLRTLTKEERNHRVKFHMSALWDFDIKEVKEERSKRNTKSKIVSIVEEFTKGIDDLKDEKSEEKYSEKANRLFENALNKLKRTTIDKTLMQTFISMRFVSADLPGMYEKMLIMLYNKDKEMFLSCFKSDSLFDTQDVTATSKNA